jgi:hypothetical protein
LLDINPIESITTRFLGIHLDNCMDRLCKRDKCLAWFYVCPLTRETTVRPNFISAHWQERQMFGLILYLPTDKRDRCLALFYICPLTSVWSNFISAYWQERQVFGLILYLPADKRDKCMALFYICLLTKSCVEWGLHLFIIYTVVNNMQPLTMVNL